MSGEVSTAKPAWRWVRGNRRHAVVAEASRTIDIGEGPGRESFTVPRCVISISTLATSSGCRRRSMPATRSDAVLLGRQGGGLAVAGALGQRIDGGAAHARVRVGVGVQGDEQIGLGRPGATHPFAQRDEKIAAPRQRDAVAAASGELALQLGGHGVDHGLFLHARGARRARIRPAMAGVEHDQPGPGRRGRLGFGSSVGAVRAVWASAGMASPIDPPARMPSARRRLMFA